MRNLHIHNKGFFTNRNQKSRNMNKFVLAEEMHNMLTQVKILNQYFIDALSDELEFDKHYTLAILDRIKKHEQKIREHS